MEEKRREAGSPSPAATISGGTSIKSTDSPLTEPPPRRRGQKRKATTSTSAVSSAPPKRHAREKAAAAAAAASGGVLSLPPIHNGPLTRSRQLSDSNAAIFSALNAMKNEASVMVNDAAVVDGREEVNVAQEEEFKKFEAVIEAEFEGIRTRDSNVHVVPVAAGWFSWTNIHSIEKQTMRSFFNGKSESRTPEIYKEIRNWIMKKFHANPSTNIELKDLSELSVGDLEARQEIMEFLEHWGLINYHPSHQNDADNVNVGPNTDAEKAEKRDSVLEKLFQFENEQSSTQFASRAKTSAAAVPSGLFPESIAEELVKLEGPAVEYHCNSCSADCSRKRYHCQKQADFDLCSECYNNGKFGSGMFPSDFILMEPAEASGSTGGKWTDQETLLLLEALELFKENWNEIAEHVATKTKAQCILHFLQMPIEDSFLDFDATKVADLENREPNSTINEISVPKVNSEISEGDTCKDISGPGESGLDGSDPLASKSSKVTVEPLERKSDGNAAQSVSAQTGTSNLEDVLDGKVVQGKGDDIIIKALKEAFNVAGCPLTSEDKLCFAEAGNTAMALVAFLSQLVEPGLANASAHSSLKTISQSSPGSQLAERHCFILEDPPEDPKDLIASESTPTEKLDQNASEMAKEELIKDKRFIHTEKSTPLVDENPSTEGQVHAKDSDTRDNPQLPSTELGTHADDSKSIKNPNEEIPQVTEKPNEENHLVEKPNEEKLLVLEKPEVEKSQVTAKADEEKSQVTEKPDEGKLKVVEKHDDITINKQAGLKIVDDPENCGPKNEQSSATTKYQVASGSGPEELTSVADSAVCMNALKDTDMGPTSVSDKTEQQDISTAVPMEGVVAATGEDKMDVDRKEDIDTKPTRTEDEDKVAKLKRAALATLSAAAVKAKLLANQEEDEIRQLATVLIEKQIRKLEIKLSYFTDLDNAFSRIREHLERSRQKLFNERAQIIASRLGIPPSSRMLPSSYPINRMPPGFVNSMMRPPMSSGAQRPPISRPVVTSVPSTTNTPAPPAEVGGNSAQPPAAENPSVETK